MAEVITTSTAQIVVGTTVAVTSALVLEEIREQRKNGRSPLKLAGSLLWRGICALGRGFAALIRYCFKR